MRRRKMLKGIGTACVVSSVSTGLTAAQKTSDRNESSRSRKVIYADENGQIVRVAPHSYIVRGAKTRDEFDFLLDKRDELIGPSSGDFSTATHDDSGTDTDSGSYQGKSWDVTTDFWAKADNGRADMSGTAEANWWGTGYWHDNKIDTDSITITSVLRASVENVDSLSISAPPAYNVQEEYRKATLNHTFTDNNHPSLSHEEGTVVFTVDNCFNWVEQDDRFKYVYETGDVEYYGTYVRADVGHCGDYSP